MEIAIVIAGLAAVMALQECGHIAARKVLLSESPRVVAARRVVAREVISYLTTLAFVVLGFTASELFKFYAAR